MRSTIICSTAWYISGLAAVTVGMMASSAAPARSQGTPDIRSWVDAYYAEYAAMSAAPTGPAMDRWLARYAPYVFFEDPTLGSSAIGRDTIRKAYVEGFTGPLGPVQWNILRRVTIGDWVAVEGGLEGTHTGKPFRTRFTTWLEIRDGRIAHQIDYVDYASIRQQGAGVEPVPVGTSDTAPPSSSAGRDAGRALAVVDELYRRYEAIPVLASSAGVDRYADMLTEDFTLEDPTARMHADGREKIRAVLNALLAKGEYGVVHWEVDRRLTDGEWVVVEGTWRGMFKNRPFATRFTTWFLVRGDKVARQIDYLDYQTFRRQTEPRK